jgi:hypothetical protein
MRRMECHHEPMMRRKRLDFVSIWECRLVLPTSAFVGTNPTDEPITSGLPLIQDLAASGWQRV